MFTSSYFLWIRPSSFSSYVKYIFGKNIQYIIQCFPEPVLQAVPYVL